MKILGDFVLTHTDIRGSMSLLVHLKCGCNMNCFSCYNYEDLIKNEKNQQWLEVENLYKHLDINSHMYDIIILSGGEPTLCGKDLINLCKTLKKNWDVQVALNTNGTNPDLLHDLIYDKYVDKVYMDLKFPIFYFNLNKYNDLWEKIHGIPFNQNVYDAVLKSLKVLFTSEVYFELRTVKYPFLNDDFLENYSCTVEEFNNRYGKSVTHQFNDFYARN